MKVAIASKTFIEWGGGVDFIIYLSNALALDPTHQVYFLVPDTHENLDLYVDEAHPVDRFRLNFFTRAIYKPHLQDEVHLDSIISDLADNVEVVLYRNDTEGFIKTLDKIQADVVLPTTASFGPEFPFPWIGYVWDFQHKYFPEYFNNEELLGRDRIFLQTLNDAPAVLVNSKNTQEDIRKFLKVAGLSKVTSLPFAPYPLRSWLETDVKKALKKYHIGGRYFIICNQFWLHKSHATALKAMSLILSKVPNVQLICTGKMEEPRDEGYIDRIKKMVKDLAISEEVRFLGLIPKSDQIALLRGSIALIQPTLYEGGPGGGAAYNAVALGVPVVASDIPINLEMKGEPGVDFFKASSASSLARKMVELYLRKRVQKTTSQLVSDGNKRTKKLIEALNSTIDHSIKNHSG